jgi:CRISPR-associated endonuclease/helicase Cas3
MHDALLDSERSGTNSDLSFEGAFQELMGAPPFPWQRRLFQRMVTGDWPTSVDIPTGLGKTSVMALWLLAAAWRAPVPGRLVYVVNRRTIVDQATGIAERLRERLDQPGPGSQLALCRRRLLELAGEDDPDEARTVSSLAISTLRGQFADNEEWLRKPARPTIVVGTIDMIGSRLLFRGYRSSWKRRSFQAGLLGQDALIVHDEAHLSPPFQRLVEWIASCQALDSPPAATSLRPIRVLEMSATRSRNEAEKVGGSRVEGPVFSLDEVDRETPEVVARFRASKRLTLHPLERRDQVAGLVRLALEHEGEGARVIVFVRSPATALKVFEVLNKRLKDPERVALLTGTIRGYERDRLLREKPSLRYLTGDERPDRTHYLVSTSAGEVGADFDADHVVCDQTHLGSLIQRLGRVNRRGGPGREARVDLVFDAQPPARPTPLDLATARTLELLGRLPQDSANGTMEASPEALRDLVAGLQPEDWVSANPPEPPWRPPHEAILDAWSLTSVVESWALAPEVSPFLHGETEAEPPETLVAWRWELDLLRPGQDHGGEALEDQVRSVLDVHGLRTHELVRETRSQTVVELLKALKNTPATADSSFVVSKGGTVMVHRLGELADEQALTSVVRAGTVILPRSAGGLNEAGMLDPGSVAVPARDVADSPAYVPDSPRRRFRLVREAEGGWSLHDVPGGGEPLGRFASRVEATRAALRTLRRDGFSPRLRKAVQSRLDFNGEVTEVILFVGAHRARGKASGPVPLEEHVRAVVEEVHRGVSASLPGEMLRPFLVAAGLHDHGKAREVWQAAVRNPDPARPWGKSGAEGMDGRLLAGYRHEFGSLVDALGDPGFQELPEADQELVLHLIAAHHGRGRPHFTDAAIRHPHNHMNATHDRLLAPETARRFDRLQRSFGPWGLAWLEALFMGADAAASAQAGEDEE